MKKGLFKPNLLFLICLPIGLYLTYSLITSTPVKASTGINQTINFQGRLLNAQGATVPDGHYNVQFKIYQDGDGQSVGNTTGSPAGSLKWTENYLNNNSQGVTVVNGYLSVKLGSVTPFGSSIDWNQDTLWLSMNIGGTNLTCTPFASCSPDGEMVPMQPMTAAPYALNAGLLGGLSSTQFVQLAQGLQTDASTANSLYINKTGGSGNIMDLQSGGTDVFLLGNSGDVTSKHNSTTAFQIQNAAGTSNLFIADTTNTRIGIGAAPATSLLTIGTNTTTAAGGITFGTDTSLYRKGAGIVYSDGEIDAGSYECAQLASLNQVCMGATAAATPGPGLVFGSASDTNLYRSGAGVLLSDGEIDAKSYQCAQATTANVVCVGATAPSTAGAGLAFGSSFDTNIYRAAADVLKTDDSLVVQAATNSTTVFQVLPSGSSTPVLNVDTQNSRVGIGTAAPAQALDVNGTVRASSFRATGGSGLINDSSSNNARVLVATTGTTIDRNIADANPALIVQQVNASSTGDILQLKNNSAIVVSANTSGLTLATGKTLTVNGEGFTDLTGTGLTDSSNALSIDTTASLTWTGTETFNSAVSITPNSTNDVTINGDNDTNFKLNSTVSSDVSINPFDLTLTDNASASTGSIYGLSVTNADNGANTGVPDALAYLKNANDSETVPDALLIEQTGTGALTNGIEIKRTAGTIANGLVFSGTGYTNYIDTPSSTFKVDGSGNTTAADITCASTNCISLGGETSGNYVASISNGTGITGGNGGSEGSALTLSIDQSASLTWTGTETFTPSGTNNVVFNGDDNSNVQVATTVTGNASSDGLIVTWTDNGSSTNSAAALKVVNAANGANAGVPAALAYLLNSNNTADTIPAGLLVEQNGTNSTLTSGVEIRQTAGTVTTGLQFTGTFGALLKVGGTTVIDSSGNVSTARLSGNYVASITNGTGISGSCSSNACAASLSIDQSANLTWTGAQAFNGSASFTPNSSNDVVVNSDNDSNLQVVGTISSDVSQTGLAISLTDNASASTGSIYGLSVTNNDNGANTGVPDALAYLNNANANETVTDGLLVEQTGGGTLTNGLEIKRTAGAVTNGLTFSGTFTNLISATNFSVTNAGAGTLAGNLAVNGGTISSSTTLTLDGTSATIIPDADTFQTNDVTSTSGLTLSTSGGGSIVLDNSGGVAITSVNGEDVTITPSANLNVGLSGNGQFIVNATTTTDVTNSFIDFELFDNANASSGSLYGLSITNNDNGANTGVPDALSHLANANAAETVPDGLLIEQTGAGTMTRGIEIKRTAGAITNGLVFSGTGYTNYIDTPSSVFKVDGSGNTTTADITCASTNCITLSTETSGNYVASITNGTGISGGNGGSEGAALTLSIDTTASLTWTGTEAFNGPTSFTPNSTNDVAVNGDNDSNLQANATITSDVSQSALQVSLTDNASASTGSVYGLSVTNNDNGANTGVADALAYLNNANAAETTPDGLLIEQTGVGTLTNGLEIKRTAGTITTGLLFSGTGYTSYIDTPSSTFKVDGSGNVTTADITCASTNCITLSTETSGNYVASITNGTGISGGNGGSEGAALTLSIDQSSSLTWTGTEAFNGTTTFTPSGSNNVTLTGDDNSNFQVTSTIGADVTQNALAITLTDNASASTGTLYGLSLTNADNSTNTGVPDALAYFKNANNAETVPAGLLVEQTGSGTLTSGVEIKRSAGSITNGLTFTGSFTNLINASTFSVTNGGAVSTSGNLTIGASAGSGTLITNNGAIVNSTLALSNFDYSGSGNSGSIGSAASTVDIYTSISINQTTSGQTLTIPNPTASTTYGRTLYISNIGSQSFILAGIRIPQGSTATLVWSNSNGGASWQFAGAGGASIENQNTADQTADFRISGTGRANTSFTSPLFDSITGSLSIGTSTATGVTVGGTTNTTSIVLQGAASATYDVGTATGTGNITLGKSTAGQVINIGAAQVATGNTQTIHIGDSATGTGKDVIAIGNTNGASSLTLSAGTGGISLAADTTVSAGKELVVGSNATDLTCTNGAIYYNSGTNRFKGCENGTWITIDSFVDVRSYTSGDTAWTLPQNASVVQVILVGAGGGGGGGGSKNGGAERNGGGGGAAGVYASQIFQASDLASTAHADVGTAGSSGAGASGNGVNGSNGGGGGASCFSSTSSCGGTVYVKGYGGGGGAGGGGAAAGLGGGGGGGGTAAAGSNATTITGGTGGLPQGMAANANASGGAGGGGGTGTGGGAGNGNAGGAAEYGGGGGGGSAAGNSTSGNGGSSLHGAGGGGGGASINSGNSTGTGGAGGSSQTNTSGGGGAAGTSGSACNAGGDATAGAASTTSIKAGSGGGGGGANGGGGGVGCSGGTGGAPGGGGGGGGAGTSSAGAGGAGGAGKIWIISW